jgi:cell wall-associated NlpC family hydrolase
MKCGPLLASVRMSPEESAEQVTQLVPGEPVEVVASEGDWSRVVTVYAYPGWVRSAALEEGEGRVRADADDSPLVVARTYLGAPYLWGGMSEAGIDCSGLVHMAHRRVGRLVPRDARDQDAVAAPVGEPEPGDLVTYGDPVDHVAFWVSDGVIFHATDATASNASSKSRSPRPYARADAGFVVSEPEAARTFAEPLKPHSLFWVVRG